MKEEPFHLFVYGSLMRRFDLPMHRLILDHGWFLDEGRLQGKLYQIAWYPGVVCSGLEGDWVYGEVFSIERPEALMPRLDAFEDCKPDQPLAGEYRRLVSEVSLTGGGVVNCHWYCYNRKVDESKRILSGKFTRLDGEPVR